MALTGAVNKRIDRSSGNTARPQKDRFMQNLFNAIVLEVGFYSSRRANTPANRKAWFCGEVAELRLNSNFNTEAEYRLITAAFVIDAVRIKVEAKLRAGNAGPGFILHYRSGGTPYHCKTSYVAKGPAQRAADKLNARDPRSPNPYVVSSVYEYVAKTRGKLVQNLMSRTWVMETTGTNYSMSVASESYWSN
jgi:hypothetical protein